MPTHLSDDFKLAIVQQIMNGSSIYSLSKQFNLSSRSIRRWIEKYQQTNSVRREIRKHSIDDIICLNETAVQLFMYKSYSRCRLGRRCVVRTSKNTTFKSYT